MKIIVAGDFCPRDRVNNLIEEYNYEYVLGEVRNILREGDYSIVNFECPIVEEGGAPISKNGPNLKCSSKGLDAIKWTGFNCVTLANNHFLDYGKEGVEKTIDTCEKLGIDYVGGGVDLKQAERILYKNLGNQRLAIVNCCEYEFSIATVKTAGSNHLNPIKQFYAIQEAKNNADFVIVIVHGGHEHFQLPSLRMVETYRFFIDAGADVVINHHQHCFSGFEIHNGKPIFYGLGNFCFDNPKRRSGIWTEGYIVVLELAIEGVKFELKPYVQCAENASVKMLPQNAYKERINELNNILKDPIKLRTELEKYYESCEDAYRGVFEPIRNRYYLGAAKRKWLPSLINKRRLLVAYNFVLCESHRDKMKFWLKHALNNKYKCYL